MKTYLFPIMLLLGFGIYFSCKNNQNEQVETSTDVVDSLVTETLPTFKYVTAVSGLTLRKSPNLQSEKLVVMPLGTKVTIVNAEEEHTMNVGGIDGAMDEVEYNGQKGFAFNGFLSKFSSVGQDAKSYAEALKKDFPEVDYSEATGGAVNKPTKTETLVLPTK